MGVNNRARRAAKRNKRRANSPSSRPRTAGVHQVEPAISAYDLTSGTGAERLAVAAQVSAAVHACAADPRRAGEHALRLLRASSSPDLVVATLDDLLVTIVGSVVRHGWAPGDLAEITRRRLGGDHVPALAGLLGAERDRYPSDRVPTSWAEDLGRLGPATSPDLRGPAGLAMALRLAGVLRLLPSIQVLIPPLGTLVTRAGVAGTQSATTDHRQLARVRALLAKAESTEFDEEAEALSAKAQELISRYSLERLVDEAELPSGQVPVTARRLWIDAPYVFPKATLVSSVARANRCDAVLTEDLGFATVFGEAHDLDAVELLSTSLLVQANTGMLRLGRQVERGRATRSTSFRRAFLLAYAARIGERLQAADDQAVERAGRTGELVPVLARREAQVRSARDEVFPRLRTREATISSAHGWAAGRAAADHARLDQRAEVTHDAG